ncbi:Trans-aconitate 2-methyltransferase [Penicillium lagena]|uniref:Trans-aconitate 2-methyltransferase n=1 Tax=Penicillium lagena TaxID=94218 RepID=UPI00254104D6|nr:Trans-aconitate 2-methyltransferase [Penicillium lagena]KAJ5601858.1 Trans-aconitate 2-methyltransferase [Penicillium lagena]
MVTSTGANPAHDWSAAQYLKFEDERTMPARDLLSRVPLQSPKNIVDLGCGPGNSTAVLESRYPNAHLVGMDSSPDMIRKAKTALPHREFSVGDITSYSPKEPVDLYYSNAVFQWLKREERFSIVRKLMETQPSGGVFALQVPDNLMEPSHVLMRETARNGPWSGTLANIDRDTFQSPQEIYDELKPFCSAVNVFHTSYYHALESHEAVIEWVKGTGLRPYLDPLQPEEKEEFLRDYLKRLKAGYPVSVDGKVLLRYPRLFVVAIKK